MSDVFQPQVPSHSSSPLRTFAAVILVLFVFGGSYYYFSAKQDTSTIHSSPPEVTPQNDSSTESSTEYDYQWGPSITSGYNTFEDLEFGFSVDYPDTWDFDPAVGDSGIVVSFSGNETIDGISRYGSASIGLMELPLDMTVDEYDQSSDDSLLEDYSFTYVDRGTQQLGVYDARYIVGTYDFSDGSHSVFLSVVAVNDGVGYTFNGLFDYGEESSFEPVLDHMSFILDEMMASFVVNHTPDFSSYYETYEDPSIGEVMLNDLFELRSKFETPRHVRKRS